MSCRPIICSPVGMSCRPIICSPVGMSCWPIICSPVGMSCRPIICSPVGMSCRPIIWYTHVLPDPCENCRQTYIGETRFEENKKEVETITRRESVTVEHKTAVKDHADINKCIIDWGGSKYVRKINQQFLVKATYASRYVE